MNNTVKKKNNCLNFFKGIACIFVIIIHVRFPNYYVYGVFQSCARFAVPLFFMISGYYAESKKHTQKAIHMAKICLGASVYWILFRYLMCFVGGNKQDLISLTIELFAPASWIRLLIFNDDPYIQLLWFLFSLLYCYLIFGFFRGIGKLNILISLILPCLCLHFLIGNIIAPLGVIDIDLAYYRNAWLMGIPLFMIGYVLRKKRQAILGRLDKWINVPNIIICFLISIVEWCITGYRCQMHVGSIFAAALIVLYAEKYPERHCFKPISIIGEKYSLYIYILHYSVYLCLDKAGEISGINKNIVFKCIQPILVIFLSIMCAVFAENSIRFAVRMVKQN